MSDQFIQLIRSKETDYLQENHPTAFLLLCLIARRACRTLNHMSGRELGEAEIGDWHAAGLTRKQYRTALATLERLNLVEKIETRRNVKKRATQLTTKRATKGTLVKLLDSRIFDINKEIKGHSINHQRGHQRATQGPRTISERSEEDSLKKESEKKKRSPKITPIAAQPLPPPISPISPLFNKKYEFEVQDALVIVAHAKENGYILDSSEVKTWLQKYGKERVVENFLIMLERKPTSPGAFLQRALDKDYSSEQKRKERNIAFAKEFKEKNHFPEMQIKNWYVSLGQGYELYYEMDCDQFQRTIANRFQMA